MIFNDWLDILLFKKKPADLVGTRIEEGLKHLVIASVIVGFLSGLQQYIVFSQLPAISTIFHGTSSPLVILVSTIASPILAVIVILIGGAILHIFSLLLGGKGSFGNYVGALAMIGAAIRGTAGAVLAVIGILTALGGPGAYLLGLAIIGLLGLIVGLWQLALVVLATKAVHQLSIGRAIVAVIVIPLVIILIFAVLLAAIFITLISGLTATSSGTGFIPMRV